VKTLLSACLIALTAAPVAAQTRPSVPLAPAMSTEAALLDTVRAHLQPPLSLEGLQAAERARAMLDQIETPAAIPARVEANGALGQFFRDIDLDTAIAFHATAVMALAPRLNATDRVRLAKPLIYAYRNLAEVRAGHGDPAAALTLLQGAPAALPGVPDVAETLADEVARYRMIGQAAPPIVAPHWLGAPAGTTRVDPSHAGTVTVVEITAWWCAACQRSYPALREVVKHYGARNVRVVLATSLMGQIRADTGLTPAVELTKLDDYYHREHALTAPVAVANQPESGTDPISAAYHVYAIPEVLVTDRRGIVQHIFLGWDEGNPQRLDEAVALALTR
jgi:thiol-disulfide isomerase/thioredoxin